MSKNTKSSATSSDNKPGAQKMTGKRIAAITGIILLVLLYLMTLITAIFDNSAAQTMFRLSLFGTLAVPLLLWIYLWLYSRMTGKRTIGDPENSVANNSSEKTE